jgi:hypothetical protein
VTAFERLRDVGIDVIEPTVAERETFRQRLLPLYPTLVPNDVRQEFDGLLAVTKEPQ